MTAVFLLYPALACYLAATFCYESLLIRQQKRMAAAGFIFLAAAFAVHLAALLLRYFIAGYTPITSLHESLSFFALCTAGFFLFLRSVHKIDELGAIFAPAVAILLIAALTISGQVRPLPPVLQSYWLPVHTVFAFIGNAIFLAGFLVSLVYLLTERSIKKKTMRGLTHRFPSLETLDRVNYKCMSYGFPFLTIAIITGSLWAELAWGSYWSWDQKEIWSLITWIVYAILIHNRLAIGWRGRRTAYMMIAGFVSVLFTFVGVNLFLGGLHSYL
jgi:cytochrome c-type biogenesis protein CcsB